VASYDEAQAVPVKVVVKNFGTDTIVSMDVKYSVDGGSAVVFAYAGALPSGSTDTVTFPAMNIPSGSHSICAYTALTGDSNTFNDSTCGSFYGRPLLDLGAIALASPVITACPGSSEQVSIRIKNLGIGSINFANTPVTVISSVSGPNPVTFLQLL
jgi:hypothetical protein